MTIRKSTRRQALRICSAGLATAFAPRGLSICLQSTEDSDVAAQLAPGAPNSSQRTALIDDFRKRSEGLQDKFEAFTHKSDWTMPYRLFRPAASGKLPLVMFLSGSGGLGSVKGHGRRGAA